MGFHYILNPPRSSLVSTLEFVLGRDVQLPLNPKILHELEDMKVLRRSPDLLNNFEISSRSTTAYNEINFVLPYMGDAAILVK